MVKATTRMKIDKGRVRGLVNTVGRQVTEAAAQRTVERVKANILALGRVNTGQMINSIRSRVIYSGLTTTAEVTSNAAHTIFQEKGTRGSVARPGGVLAFTPKGSNVVVFAKRTRGVPAGRFFERALRDIRVEDFRPR